MLAISPQAGACDDKQSVTAGDGGSTLPKLTTTGSLCPDIEDLAAETNLNYSDDRDNGFGTDSWT
ncbi:hypothetical protein GCM10022627_37930 [Haloarcula argentinensis]|uniref:Uncharacterized protein n=1 Tax=Haloarcula argentinensis TaxID=43776 RepID=A0A830FQJ5_HALAR|nr:hypothetical protein GCM10009006_31120 [Haloarcula argentinensis]